MALGNIVPLVNSGLLNSAAIALSAVACSQHAPACTWYGHLTSIADIQDAWSCVCPRNQKIQQPARADCYSSPVACVAEACLLCFSA